MLNLQYDRYVADGFDELGAFVMVIDGFPAEERYEPTIELLESLGYQRSSATEIGDGEYAISTPAGEATEKSLRVFFVKFKIGGDLYLYQPLNRTLLRGKSCIPHRPESDFRFADWYPVKGSPVKGRAGVIEEQLADDFPNAAMAAQFLHDHGFKRSNTHKKLGKNTYFVASRHGDGQPSGIVFRGEQEIYFFDYYADTRFIIGPSGLIKDEQPTERQFQTTASIAMMNLFG
ncbi:hypothetical protein NZK35_01245 [Stieleria sp. ICT_E10.1]|uniref:hypothetical protein n=1 Tax=Stieleria sedimenti TaxID=2976331 RepID=UPI0021802955|nr:hypothetical protein [Stieleria sedimenti]MCS7465295.1 hypothetical protein [Stieleria sedimenti]